MDDAVELTELDDREPTADDASVDPELETRRAEMATLADVNRDVIARYRRALLASDPAIEPELVGGDSAEEIEASFEAARRLVAGIREAVRREHTTAVPAGSPGRTTSGPRTAYDKIRSGLARI